MNPALYIDPENRLSRVPYKVPNNTHYVTLAQYQLMELQLKAELERLREAGDAVCESPYLLESDPAVIAWRAAKEGKQP